MPIRYKPDAERVTTDAGLRVLVGTASYNPFAAGARKIITEAAPVEAAQEPQPAAVGWRVENPKLAAWLDANARAGDNIAVGLLRKLTQTGELSEFDSRTIRIRVDRGYGINPEAPALLVETAALKESLTRAKERGIEWPSLMLDTFAFTLAADTARWPGAVYVKDSTSGLYLGRIADGELIRTKECTDDHAARIVSAAANPSESAGAYGRLTGKCSCCRRKLTAAESIGRAVGPICWEKYFG